ncbi:MAG: hypothetical protein JNM93_10685 [Bacteriovoracaceae bacterium]|nr:hypothetical protein [Bacteriovoracaceae bacterium]
MAESVDLKTIKLNLHQRAEYKRQLSEMEKERRRYREEIDKSVKKHEEGSKNLANAYDVKLTNERANLERELISVRRGNERKIKEENDRYAQMLLEVRTAHEQQLAEMKDSFAKEVDRYEKTRAEYLGNAERKFEIEKAKMNS